GIDPEPEMLRIARQEAGRAGLRIDFREGSSRDVGAHLSTFALVLIGRAFHWMDRQGTLERLDRIVDPAGAVLLFGDNQVRVPDNRWRKPCDRIVDRYAKADTARAARRAPEWLLHEAILLDSPFSRLERVSVIERRATPVERFVDRALSLSSVHGETRL